MIILSSSGITNTMLLCSDVQWCFLLMWQFFKKISPGARLLIMKLFCSVSPPSFSDGGSGDGGMTLLATLLRSLVMALFIFIDGIGYWGHCFITVQWQH